MARSSWKGLNGSLSNNKKIWDRSAKILSQNVGQVYEVHNGQNFVEILVEEGMVGKSFGNFVMTRRMGVDVHIKKKKKKSK